MGDKSNIEWTDATWNPIVGCSIVSPGCTNCYAMKMAHRLESMAASAGIDDNGYAVRGTHPLDHYVGTTKMVNGNAVWTGKVALASEKILTDPLRWKKPRRIFVNSMGDLFHESVPDEWIDKVFAVMALCPQHSFQVLTKRSKRMREHLTRPAGNGRQDIRNHLAWDVTASVMNKWAPGWRDEGIDGRHRKLAIAAFTQWPLPNVWLGVSAEDQARADERIPDLLATPAAVRFVSAEPLLGAIDFRRIAPEQIDQSECGAGIHCCGRIHTNAFTASAQCDGQVPGEPLAIGRLDWIISGGESGPNARPMHPDWARSIRNQCAAAGVAFHFKQWGEHAVYYDRDRDDPDWKMCSEISQQKGRWLNLAGGHGFHGERVVFAEKIGKARAGRLLDGIEHNGFPKSP